VALGQPWHGQPSCQFWCFCDISLSSYLWGHRAREWCRSSYSIHIPSLKFVGLPVLKIWLIFGNSINLPSDLDLWSFDLWMGSWLLPANFQLDRRFHSWRKVTYGADRWTDRRPPSTLNAPTPWGRGMIMTVKHWVTSVKRYDLALRWNSGLKTEYAYISEVTTTVPSYLWSQIGIPSWSKDHTE